MENTYSQCLLPPYGSLESHHIMTVPTELPPQYDWISFDAEGDNELPEYSHACNDGLVPHNTFDFHQHSSKHISIVERNGGSRPRVFNVRCRTSPSFFSKKPDMTITRGTRNEGHVSSIGKGQDPEAAVATIEFDESGPLPYRPRASVRLPPDPVTKQPSVVQFESPNFKDWSFAENGSFPLDRDLSVQWRRKISVDHSIHLELVSTETDEHLAGFRFSHCGMRATDGKLMGSLTFPVGSLGVEACGGRLEVLIGGFLIALKNFQRMGHFYCNKDNKVG